MKNSISKLDVPMILESCNLFSTQLLRPGNHEGGETLAARSIAGRRAGGQFRDILRTQ